MHYFIDIALTIIDLSHNKTIVYKIVVYRQSVRPSKFPINEDIWANNFDSRKWLSQANMAVRVI